MRSFISCVVIILTLGLNALHCLETLISCKSSSKFFKILILGYTISTSSCEKLTSINRELNGMELCKGSSTVRKSILASFKRTACPYLFSADCPSKWNCLWRDSIIFETQSLEYRSAPDFPEVPEYPDLLIEVPLTRRSCWLRLSSMNFSMSRMSLLTNRVTRMSLKARFQRMKRLSVPRFDFCAYFLRSMNLHLNCLLFLTSLEMSSCGYCWYI